MAVGDIARDLNTGTGAASWTVTGAILASAVSTSLGGKFGDIYGHRRAFLAAAVMLVVVTPLSGLAWNIESLIGFRVAAGVANGVATAAGHRHGAVGVSYLHAFEGHRLGTSRRCRGRRPSG